MVRILKIENYNAEKDDHILFDVRTPAEYQKGHIADAVNLPIFTNEERAIVGTIYKQESPQKALLQGLDFVGGKMSTFIKKVNEIAPNKKIIVHCWRGGKRSASMAWLLNLAGFEVRVLEGGYKAFKNHIRNKISNIDFDFVVLGGKTGTGKTLILHALEKRGEQIIDLEKLAHHKGSAFGALGESDQPNFDQFENDLFGALLKLNPKKKIWIENESRNIGSVYLPDTFWEKMKNAPVVNIEIPFEERVQILVDEYAKFPKDELLAAFVKIKKRIGGQNLKVAELALIENDFHKAAEIALKYYDKSYQYLLENNSAPQIHMLRLESFNPLQNAAFLINFCKENIFKFSKSNV